MDKEKREGMKICEKKGGMLTLCAPRAISLRMLTTERKVCSSRTKYSSMTLPISISQKEIEANDRTYPA